MRIFQNIFLTKKEKEYLKLYQKRYHKLSFKERKYILNSKELKRLLLWLSNKPAEKIARDANGNLPRNNWENLRNNWNLANPSKEQLTPLEHNINIKLQMPNYSLLKINYNEKHF